MPRLDWPSFGAFFICAVMAVVPALAEAPSPPAQPDSGPGGTDYAYSRTLATGYGSGDNRCWIIEPDQAGDEALPVIVFVHGMGQTRHSIYRSWITHLVRRGNIVIYPVYHTGGLVDPKAFTANAARSVSKALSRCDGKRHRIADTDRLTMIGHSLGGTIIANLAARPEHFELPQPQALMLLQPGDTRADKGLGALFPSITEDHGTIPDGTLMLIVDVEDDYFVSPHAGRRIYDNAIQVDPIDKRRLLMQTDEHAGQSIVADHMLPMGWTTAKGSSGTVNAYDHALWRWFDAMQAASDGEETMRQHVFGEAALDLGNWSDGRSVRRPVDVSGK